MQISGVDLEICQYSAPNGVLCVTTPHTISVSRCPTAPVPRIPAVGVTPAAGIVRVAWRAPVAWWSVARPGAVTPAVPVSPRSPPVPVPVPVPISGPGSVAPSVITVVVAVVVVSSAVAVLVAIVSVSSSSAARLMLPVPWGAAAAASGGSVCLHGSCAMWWAREKGERGAVCLDVIRRQCPTPEAWSSDFGRQLRLK